MRLWAFAVTHAAWLCNCLPNKNLGWMSPLEIFTETKSDHQDLLRAKVWGCPAFVLHPRLQSDKINPRFDRRGRMGQFLGISEEHSSVVSLIRNLSTNNVSPQFHVVLDEKFSTIQNDTRVDSKTIESIFVDLFPSSRKYYGEYIRPPDESEGATVEDPPLELGGEWLTGAERRDKRSRNLQYQTRLQKIRDKQARDVKRLSKSNNPSWPLDVITTGFALDDNSGARRHLGC